MIEDKKNLFTDKDKKRYQSHQKGFYPEESLYKKKEKITKYKKKYIQHLQ